VNKATYSKFLGDSKGKIDDLIQRVLTIKQDELEKEKEHKKAEV